MSDPVWTCERCGAIFSGPRCPCQGEPVVYRMPPIDDLPDIDSLIETEGPIAILYMCSVIPECRVVPVYGCQVAPEYQVVPIYGCQVAPKAPKDQTDKPDP